MKGTALQPTGKAERIQYLDILRGIAIFFIFIANLISFSGWFAMADETKSAMSFPLLNDVIEFYLRVFVDGKWYSIFSILFGIGFAIQLSRAKVKGVHFPPFFFRRMMGLLLIGLLHIFFWIGDILSLYALLGLLLILFRNCKNNTLLYWATALMLAPILHMVLAEMLFAPPYFRSLFIYLDQTWVEAGFALRDWRGTGRPNLDPLYHLQTESLSEFIRINLFLPLLRLAMMLAEARAFKVLACFLIGFWAGRKILEQQLLKNHTFLKRLAILGLFIGVAANLCMYYLESIEPSKYGHLLWVSLYAIGVIPLALSYCAITALLWKANKNLLRIFEPVGKMALSNYLFQTLVSVFFFYGIGLGFAAQLSLWQIMLFGIGVFSFQCWFSFIYLRFKRQGPFEWFWRKITYS